VLALLASVAAFALAMLVGMVRGLNSRGSHLRPDAWHHLYLGVGLFLLGYAAGARRPLLALVLRSTGLVLAWDDAFQHVVQAVTADLSFRSPLHVAYAWTYEQWAWVRALTQWLDRLFGA
jgi:hypothetical protein